MLCSAGEKVLKSVVCLVCYFNIGKFIKFCNKFSFWSYVSEGRSNFFLFLLSGVFFMLCL